MKLTKPLLLSLAVLINGAVIAYWYYIQHKNYGGFTWYPPLSALGDSSDEDFNLVIKNMQFFRVSFMWVLVGAGVVNVMLVWLASRSKQ